MGKSRCPLLQELHRTPVTYPRHKQDPLPFINDFEPKGLQSDSRIDFVVVVYVVVVVVILVVDVVVIFVGEIACLSLN